jgi:biotin carboxylase
VGDRSRRLLVLGAGPAQLGLLEAAWSRGDVHVIAVDRDPAAPGLELADERALVSTEDEPAVARLADALRVDGIVSPGADWPVGVAARVAERLGLPHPLDARTAALAKSKQRQSERFDAAAVPHARALDPDDPALPLPCVVKAPDRQGQRGLALVATRDGLGAALAAARAEARGGGVLVEELVEGPELTVNAFSVDGAFTAVAVTDRLVAEPPAFGVALAHVWPSAHETGEVVDVARAAVEALGIRNGPSYTQLRVGARGPVVMEVAARLGGGHDAELCRAATGVDLNALAIDAALGTVTERGPSPATLCGGAATAFLVPPAGVLEAVEGVGDVEALPGVEWVRVYRRPGHVLGPLRRGADRAGAVLATGADREEALGRARRAADAVRFRVDANTP